MQLTKLWEQLKDKGIGDVMLYLADGSASRCDWNDTAMLGEVRVALLGDQDRGIVRIVEIDSCKGLGIPSPKGIDPRGYRSVVMEKLLNSQSPSADTAVEPSSS